MGVCGLVDMELDSRSKGLGLESNTGYVQKCQANFLFYTASAYKSVMGT